MFSPFSCAGFIVFWYTGWDQTLRIWNSKTRLEVACLSHNSQVVGLAWLDNEAAVLSLGEDGVLGKWTRIGPQNHWQWGRVLNVGSEKRALEDTVCLACARDRIAVAFPQSGVKVWIWCKGSWLAQRSIMRTNVTALKFIDDGDALLGGTREGVVWHCAVPNGMMQVYAFLQSSITSISINPTGMQALIAQAGGSACIVSLGAQDEKRVGQSYLETDLRDGTPGAIFTTQGTTVVFGTADGSLLVWDAQTGTILYGMDHPDQDGEMACFVYISSWDGPQGYVVAGTRQGRLLWWPEPQGTFVTRSCSPSLTC
ncbi:WD40-repeat-containing domain protein [Mycena polygramma]|nr:WD40-repeat-containing domain protein [Mycena polygramma]